MRKRFGQDFDGHVAPELGVVRLIHLAHSARANLREDFVGAEFGARGDRHKGPANREWPEYTAARPFSGKIRMDYGAKSREAGFLEIDLPGETLRAIYAPGSVAVAF